MAFEITGTVMADAALTEGGAALGTTLLEAAPTLFEGTSLLGEGATASGLTGAALEGSAAEDTSMYEQLMNAMNNPADVSGNPAIQTAQANGTTLPPSAPTPAQGMQPNLGAPQPSLYQTPPDVSASPGITQAPQYSNNLPLSSQVTQPTTGLGQIAPSLSSGVPSTAPGALTSMNPPSPFMDGLKSVGDWASAHPFQAGIAGYTALNALGAFKPSGQTFNQPTSNPMGFKTMSPDFQGTHPNPQDYQYTPKYQNYAEGGMAMGGTPGQNYPMVQQNHTIFATPSQMPTSAMAVRNFEPATNPLTGDTTQPMADGGVTGGGQMHLDVPINVGGQGGGGQDGGIGSLPGYGGGQSGFSGGPGYAQPPAQGMGGKGGGKGGGAGVSQVQPNPQMMNAYAQPYQNSLMGLQAQQITLQNQMGQQQQGEGISGFMGAKEGGIIDVHKFNSGGSSTDVYDSYRKFADMVDPYSRYVPPSTSHDAGIYRDDSPSTRYSQAFPAAQMRQKATDQRAYVNQIPFKTPASMSQLGGLNFAPPGGQPTASPDNPSTEATLAASGGIMGYNLGGYAEGDMPRLLKGPGDGVSDNIPATIADKQPARLADGEFVVPARIVSELGNGSTEAGAKRLHQMMDDVQKARGRTVGKGNIAVDSKAYKAIPKK